MSPGLLAIDLERQGDRGEILEGEAEDDAVFLLEPVVALGNPKAGHPVSKVPVEGVLLEFRVLSSNSMMKCEPMPQFSPSRR